MLSLWMESLPQQKNTPISSCALLCEMRQSIKQEQRHRLQKKNDNVDQHHKTQTQGFSNAGR